MFPSTQLDDFHPAVISQMALSPMANLIRNSASEAPSTPVLPWNESVHAHTERFFVPRDSHYENLVTNTSKKTTAASEGNSSHFCFDGCDDFDDEAVSMGKASLYNTRMLTPTNDTHIFRLLHYSHYPFAILRHQSFPLCLTRTNFWSRSFFAPLRVVADDTFSVCKNSLFTHS